MKKIFASFLILALIAPSFAFAAPFDEVITPIGGGSGTNSVFEGTPSPTNPATGQPTPYASGTDAAEQVGCDSGGGLGGALAQSVGGILQNIVGRGASKLRQALSGIGGSGPLGQVLGQIGDVAIGAGTRYLQNQIAGLTGDILGGITGGGAAGALTGGAVTGLTPGAQEFFNQAGLEFLGRSSFGAGRVPVIDPDQIAEQKKQLAEQEKIYKEADRIKQAQETLVTKECIADPLVQRIKQQLVAMIVRSMLDWINNGFEGGPAFVQNLRSFLRNVADATLNDFVNNQLSGICTPFQNDVKVALISQYQYDNNFQQRIQCSDPAQGGTDPTPYDHGGGLENSGVGGFDIFQFHKNIFNPQNTGYGNVLISLAEQERQSMANQAEEIEDVRQGEGFRSGYTCETDDDVGQGETCLPGDKQKNLPGTIIRDQASSKVDAGFQQLLNADEISEIIDSLMAGLLDVAFQGIDGLLGLSESNNSSSGSSGGSYLDQLVSGPTQHTTDTAQGVIIGDVNGVATVEATYKSLLDALLGVLRQTRTTYIQVRQCYTALGGLNVTYSAFATQQALYASTTVSTVVDPLIRQTETELAQSEDALEMLEDLFARVESATTPEAINAAAAAYTAFVRSGAVHTNTDLATLQNDINVNAPIIDGLYNDAYIKLTECRALTNPSAYLCAQPGAINPCAFPNPLIPILPGHAI